MKRRAFASCFAGSMVLGTIAAAQPNAPASETSAFAALVTSRNESVVDIVTLRLEREGNVYDDAVDNVDILPDNDFADRFALPLPVGYGANQERDLGSGVIISSDGYILTSAHVIADTDETQVRLSDGRRFSARIVGCDKRTDVGLLKIDARGLHAAVVGDSSKLAPGDWVAAIGTPFGFHGSVTTGVVSATNRYVAGSGEIPFVQTDVAINPGSSGSPLFNARGEVVAINSMIYSGSGGFMGLSFAVPMNLAMRIVGELRANGKVRRARLGAEMQEVNPALAQSFRLPDASGALVVRVQRDGPAASAGLLRGDVVRAIDGVRISHFTDLVQDVAQRQPGTSVRLELWRQGRAARATVVLEEEAIPSSPKTIATPLEWNDGLGLRLGELSRAQKFQLGIEEGLMVREAAGAARSEGIRPGDIVMAINDSSVDRIPDMARLLAVMAPGRVAALLVQRNGRRAYVPVPIPDRGARRDSR
ncbi:trypsin-like peptidase domain-containing protein [Variovorax rhizosphaerae]|uniref:Probable periplasmic serine endoprotease DegP-like n=1 Tax=Variovorax rhizosphaerae TaxID=1836200 RepID=A0ABU8WVB3_9BURK